MLLSSTWMKTKLILSCWKITSLKLGWIAISKFQLAKLHEETSLCYKKLQLSQKIFLIDLLTFIDKICQNREKALTKYWVWGSQREHTIKSTGSLITMFVTQKHQFICSTSNVEIIKSFYMALSCKGKDFWNHPEMQFLTCTLPQTFNPQRKNATGSNFPRWCFYSLPTEKLILFSVIFPFEHFSK